MAPDEDYDLSAEGLTPDHPQKTKKRRLHGACDACRKKKVKCDSAKMLGNICTNCQLANIDCTHDTPRQPKKSETQAIYIQTLERKIEILLQLLREAYPDQDVDHLVDTMSNQSSQNSTPDPPSHPSASSQITALRYPTLQSTSNELHSTSARPADDPLEAEDLEHLALRKQLSSLSLDTVEERFFGQSSAFMFFKHVTTVKSEATGVKPSKPDANSKRSPSWNVRPWEMAFATSQEPAYVYPDEDLLQTLVFIYFDKFNPFYPLLHQPTFMRLLLSGEHHRDPEYGMIVLLVCACASRYSNDPRVMMPGDTSGLSAGWRFFSQVPMHRNRMVYKTGLYDLQYYALALVYLHSTSIPNTASSLLGLGMQHALERGVHRRKPAPQKPTVEGELLKRAFWCLVIIDRFMGSFLGRPSMINDEDFDVDYPIECDDEYWETEDPNQAFKQPLGKPSTITAFVQTLKLCEMLAFTLRTLYSTKKSKVLSGLVGGEWEGRIVAQLTASMAAWKESVPHFLRWNPNEQNSIFFHQSAYLYATYCYIQILIHRPFLTKKSPLSFPALATCTNAARTCADMLEVAATRGLRITTPNMIMAIVSAGLVSVLNIWGNRQSGLSMEPESEMPILQKCMDVLKACERRAPMAGRLCDLLGDLAALNQYQPTSNKRSRETLQSTRKLPAQFPTTSYVSRYPEPTPAVVHNTNVTATLPEIPLDMHSASAMAVNDWDLSNLLLIEMGYTRPLPDSGYTQETKEYNRAYQLPSDGLHSSVTRTMGSVPHVDYSSGRNINNFNEEYFSLWSDMPTSFNSIHEWNSYLANYGTV